MPKRTRDVVAHSARRRARGSRPYKWGYKMGRQLNYGLAHRHVVTCSTSTAQAITVTVPSSGVALFNTGGLASPNMQIIFTLGNMVINLGGTSILVVPLPNAAELVALYDQYTIEKVDLSIWCGNTNSQIGVLPVDADGTIDNYANQPMPLIGWAPDMDDAANTSITDLQQYSNYKCKQLGQSVPIKTSVVPCVQDTIYRPGATSAYSRGSKQAINCSYQDVPHYGIKLCVDGFKCQNVVTNALNCFLSIQAKYHLKMECTR